MHYLVIFIFQTLITLLWFAQFFYIFDKAMSSEEIEDDFDMTL